MPTSAPNSARPVQHTSPGMDEEVHLAMDAEVLRRQEKYELGEKGILHSFYSTVAEPWLEFGRNLGKPWTMKANCFSFQKLFPFIMSNCSIAVNNALIFRCSECTKEQL